MVLFVALVLPASIAAMDAVQVQDHGDGRYTLSTKLDGTTDPAHGMLVITPTATELCGALYPHFGRYRFEGREPSKATGEPGATSLDFTQQIECREAPQEQVETVSAPVPAAPATPPTDEDASLIRDRTLAYLRTKDAVDANGAFAMFSRDMSSYATPEDWAGSRKAFNAKAGAGAEPNVVRITWYDNPQGAPALGRYAAADYSVDYPSQAFTCGYVVWLRQADGGYLIVREEEGQATPELVAGLSLEQKASMRAQLQCRD